MTQRPMDPVCGPALALRDPMCPGCGAVPLRIHNDQPALFYHAGYGATTRLVVDVCRCRTRLVAREATR